LCIFFVVGSNKPQEIYTIKKKEEDISIEDYFLEMK